MDAETPIGHIRLRHIDFPLFYYRTPEQVSIANSQVTDNTLRGGNNRSWGVFIWTANQL